MTAYLAQVTDRTTVSRVLGISWQAVGSIVERVVAQRLDERRFDGLRRIGIDEFSYRKRHHYLTIVVDHDRRRVVWAGKGRSAKTLEAFFDRLGPAGCERLQLVTVDLAASWQKALRARVPHARVVFDRFHVESLASEAVDEVRRTEQRGADAKTAKALKGSRYCLLKHPKRLKPGEKRRLAAVRRANRALDRAYELKEYLATILEQATPDDAEASARRVAGVGGAVTPGAVREAGADGPQARRGDPRLPRHADDERAGRGHQQQTPPSSPAAPTASTRTVPSSRCCSSAVEASNWPRPYPHVFEETRNSARIPGIPEGTSPITATSDSHSTLRTVPATSATRRPGRYFARRVGQTTATPRATDPSATALAVHVRQRIGKRPQNRHGAAGDGRQPEKGQDLPILRTPSNTSNQATQYNDGEGLAGGRRVGCDHHGHGDGHGAGGSGDLGARAPEHGREEPDPDRSIQSGRRAQPGRDAEGERDRQRHHGGSHATEQVAPEGLERIVPTVQFMARGPLPGLGRLARRDHTGQLNHAGILSGFGIQYFTQPHLPAKREVALAILGIQTHRALWKRRGLVGPGAGVRYWRLSGHGIREPAHPATRPTRAGSATGRATQVGPVRSGLAPSREYSRSRTVGPEIGSGSAGFRDRHRRRRMECQTSASPTTRCRMTGPAPTWRVLNIEMRLDEPESVLRDRAAAAAGIDPERVRGMRIARRSVDARRRGKTRRIRFIVHVDLVLDTRRTSVPCSPRRSAPAESSSVHGPAVSRLTNWMPDVGGRAS